MAELGGHEVGLAVDVRPGQKSPANCQVSKPAPAGHCTHLEWVWLCQICDSILWVGISMAW